LAPANGNRPLFSRRGYSGRREGARKIGTGGDGHHARLRTLRDANAKRSRLLFDDQGAFGGHLPLSFVMGGSWAVSLAWILTKSGHLVRADSSSVPAREFLAR
jgi:hypothetical protein